MTVQTVLEPEVSSITGRHTVKAPPPLVTGQCVTAPLVDSGSPTVVLILQIRLRSPQVHQAKI